MMYRRMNPKQLEKEIEDLKKWKMGRRTTTHPKPERQENEHEITETPPVGDVLPPVAGWVKK